MTGSATVDKASATGQPNSVGRRLPIFSNKHLEMSGAITITDFRAQNVRPPTGWSRAALVMSPRGGPKPAARGLPEDDDVDVDANEIDRLRAESWRFWGVA